MEGERRLYPVAWHWLGGDVGRSSGRPFTLFLPSGPA